MLVALAGCASAPGETTTTPAGTETFEVQMTGNATATYIVSAELVADPFENVSVSYANRTNRTVAVPDQKGSYLFGPDSDVTAVEPRDEVVDGVYFEGSPRFSVTANEVPPTGNLVYSIREKGEPVFLAWGFIRCGGHITGLSIQTTESGIERIVSSCDPSARSTSMFF